MSISLESVRKRSLAARIVFDASTRLRAAVEGAAAVRLLRGLPDSASAVGTAISNSRPGEAWHSLSKAWTRTRAAVANARLAMIWSRCIRFSAIYNGPSVDPGPEEVVIDVRKTRSVGTVVVWADRAAHTLASGAATSTVRRIASDCASSFRTRPIRIGGVIVLSGTVTSASLTALFDTISSTSLIIHVVLVALGAVGLSSSITFEQVFDARFVRRFVSAFEPPRSPEPIDDTSRRTGTEE